MAESVQSGGASRGQAYVVLARRHRPARFEQVVGQEHVTRTLQNAIRAGRVHHAYLFTGSRGVGKTTVARILAKALNCEKGPTPDPCEACDSCKQAASGAVDIFEIDGASHTGVDDVRELRENVRYLPARARNKIYIIDEVHMLSTSAFNALLKTLEEPPPHVVFIFATTEPHKIPATILSRCQRFDFKRVPGPMLLSHLERLTATEGVKVDSAGLSLIVRASEGSVRDSLSLLDQVIAYAVGEETIDAAKVAELLGVTDRRVLFELSAALLAREADRALAVVDRLFSDGQDLSQFAQAFLAHLRDLIVVRSCREPRPLLDVTEAELEELVRQAKGDGAELLEQHFDRFARTAQEIARSSFPRLLLELVLIELVNAEPLVPLGDLLQRLADLEARLGGAGPSPSSPVGGAGPRGVTGYGPRGATESRGSAPAPSRPAPAPAPRRAQGSSVATPWAQRAEALAASAPPAEAEPASAPVTAPVPVKGPAPVAAPVPIKGPAPVAASPPVAASAPVAVSAPMAVSASPVALVPAPTPVRPVLSAEGGEALAGWQALLRQVEAAQPVAASVYVAGRLLAFDGKSVELGYPPGSFELRLAQDRDKRSAFEQACLKAAGRELAVTARALRPEEASAPDVVAQSALEAEARERARRAEQLRDEARGHPIVRALVERCGAQIEHIHVIADGEQSR
ncbi:MAG: DNA polymerase III subunit gamma/tau [Deltaproteobacteria bacterium]|nr:DNA polymerase III subunit gamma/tau [Deltaproteobacteria bacterium]